MRVSRSFAGSRLGEKAGYPRFKSSRRWHTMELAEVTKSMLKAEGDYYRVRVKGLPVIRLRRVRDLPDVGNLKGLSITRRGRRLFVNLTYAEEVEAVSRVPGIAVGIDMGVTDRIAMSTGERIERRTKDTEGIARAQRRLSRCAKGSRRWRERRAALSNIQYRERVKNRNECHRITTDLVRRFPLIVVEELQVRNMVKSAKGTVEEPGTNVKQKSGLNRSINEQTWGVILNQLAYKAESAGARFVHVSPNYTSRTCSECKYESSGNRNKKDFKCLICGHSDDADVNAAKVILHRGLAGGNAPPSALEAA